MALGLFPKAARRHISRGDNFLDDVDLIDNRGHDLDSTPEARYDIYWELGPQEANVSQTIFAEDGTGAPAGASGNQPLPVGVPQTDTPQIGFKPAATFGMGGLQNEGVLAPPPFFGAVSLQNPNYWYDGGAMEPMWQTPNNTSPSPQPWDLGLTLGFGPIETLATLAGG